MPSVLGFERVNVRRQPPNPLINFIKPLPGADEATAHDFLCRVAAVCAPIMRANGVRVMALEEFPANREFLGRNFNGGECIQLVLRTRAGAWLPLRSVQRVMMHELAHNAHMNHSRDFWKVRNHYCEELDALWRRGYSGDGLWGRGVSLYDGQLASLGDAAPGTADVADLCGGTYRGRRHKRKAPSQLTYAQREARRIKRKFGEGGVALGDDEDLRVTLEKGKAVKGKPRVAGSNRGRELRAAAALARFSTTPAPIKPEAGQEAGQDEFDEFDGLDDGDFDCLHGGTEARGPNGEALRDGSGLRLVKVCEDEDSESSDARREMDELSALTLEHGRDPPLHQSTIHETDQDLDSQPRIKHENYADVLLLPRVKSENDESETDSHGTRPPVPQNVQQKIHKHDAILERTKDKNMNNDYLIKTKSTRPPNLANGASPEEAGASPGGGMASVLTSTNPAPTEAVAHGVEQRKEQTCPACHLDNDLAAVLCAACANVLRPALAGNVWRCRGEACEAAADVASVYLNAGDAGRCGVCGAARPD